MDSCLERRATEGAGDGASPVSTGDKKETGRLGPVSRASAEMRLHHSLAPAGFGDCAARDASASASRTSKSAKGARVGRNR
jgi:hypothetical protein